MITSDSKKQAAFATNALLCAAVLAKKTKVQLADALGINRNTLAKNFDTGDMKLTEFLQLSSLLGQNPSKILEQAEKQAALASKEKSQPCLPG